jgi:serine/threonine protein kinase
MQVERLGPYQIVGKLGRGGMGTVYEAVNLETGEPAAVKLLSPALAAEEGFRERFEAEIETLRKLNHPNIVRLFGFGEQDEQLFYAMELIDGNSLEEELSRGRRFDWREVVRIAIEICRALRHAHDRGVIHRDIKPGNLLMSSTGQIKLSDFGIARLFGNTRLTSAGSVLGTAEYMAAEQAAGRPVDQRADLYSLGAVMYALLARRPVFRGKSLAEMLHKHQFETPEPLSKYNDDVPEELQRIILQLLEKDPARRIANAAILGRCFEAMQHAMPLPASTIHADPSYYEAPAPPGDVAAVAPAGATAASATDNAAPASQAEYLELADSVVSDTQPFPAPAPPSVPPPASAPELPDTVATQSLPAEKTVPESPPKSTGHFVAVSREELGKEEYAQPKIAFPSLQTWALAAALLLVGLVIWYLLQPLSADALYSRIASRIEIENENVGSESEKLKALLDAEDDINAFLQQYSGDHRAGKLRKYQKEIDLYRRQRKFDLHISGLADAEALLPIERAYLEAMSLERVNPEQSIAKLQAIVDLYSYSAPVSGPVGECLTLARRRLEQLKQDVEKRAAEQIEILQRRLDEADKLLSSDPEEAQAMYRAAVELYSDKPWAAEVVRRAQAALDKFKPDR